MQPNMGVRAEVLKADDGRYDLVLRWTPTIKGKDYAVVARRFPRTGEGGQSFTHVQGSGYTIRAIKPGTYDIQVAQQTPPPAAPIFGEVRVVVGSGA